MSDHGIFESLETSDGEVKESSKLSQQRLAAAIYDVKERYGDFILGATALDEFHDRLALVKSDMMKTVDQHLMPVTGVMRRVVKALKDDWRKRVDLTASFKQACGPYESFDACVAANREKDNPEAYCGSLEQKTKKSSRTADKTGPAMNLDRTFSPSEGDLIPEGNFKGYLDSVDQGAESKISDRFVDTETPTQEHTGDPAKTDFTKDSSVHLQVFKDWCDTEGLRTASVDAFEKYAENLSDEQYFKLAAELQRQAFGLGGISDMVSGVGDAIQQGVGTISGLAGGLGGGGGSAPLPAGGAPGRTNDLAGAPAGMTAKRGKLRGSSADHCSNGTHEVLVGRAFTAQGSGKSTNYLQKADDALTQLLNQKAEEFQETIAPLQQALQIVQQNEAMQSMMSPMAVQPPAGSVNVLPGTPQGPGMPGDPGGAAAAAGAMAGAQQMGGGQQLTGAVGEDYFTSKEYKDSQARENARLKAEKAKGRKEDPDKYNKAPYGSCGGTYASKRHDLTTPGACEGGEDTNEPTMNQPPADWHHRDRGGKWTAGRKAGGARPKG